MKIIDLLMHHEPGELLLQLRESGRLKCFLPELDCLFGVIQNEAHHPEVDTGSHIALCLEMARILDASPAARFAVLVHDLGKAHTPIEELPRHIGHEKRGLGPVRALCARLVVPPYWRRLALLVCEYHLHAHRALEMRAKSVLKLLNETGLETDWVLRKDFLDACEADKRGRKGKSENQYPQARFLHDACIGLKGLWMEPGTQLIGKELQELHSARLQAVRTARRQCKETLAPSCS